MASASVVGKSKQSKSDPNRGDGPLATATSDPNSSPAPLSRYESQKRRDWNTFGQYLRNQRPPIAPSGCRDNHVLDFLMYLDQFGKTKVHLTGCPFFGNPEPPGPCAYPLTKGKRGVALTRSLDGSEQLTTSTVDRQNRTRLQAEL